MMDLLKRFNWVDILVIALALRIVYVSVKTGVVAELMKTLGVLLAIFISFHYYVKLAVFTGHYVAFSSVVLEVVAFVALWLATIFVCKLSRSGILMLFSVEAISAVDKWGAVIVSAGRFFLTVGMFMFVFLLTDNPYMERMTVTSFSQKYVMSIAPKVYRKMTDGFVVKFFPREKLNPAVFEELGQTGKK